MPEQRNFQKLIKTLAIVILIATLAYLFHPDVGQMQLTINGEQVADPLARFGVATTLLLLGAIITVILVLVFIGVGLLILLPVAFLALFGVFFVAPYFWPVFIALLLILLLAIPDNKTKL